MPVPLSEVRVAFKAATALGRQWAEDHAAGVRARKWSKAPMDWGAWAMGAATDLEYPPELQRAVERWIAHSASEHYTLLCKELP